jgi:hypothetical protein
MHPGSACPRLTSMKRRGRNDNVHDRRSRTADHHPAVNTGDGEKILLAGSRPQFPRGRLSTQRRAYCAMQPHVRFTGFRTRMEPEVFCCANEVCAPAAGASRSAAGGPITRSRTISVLPRLVPRPTPCAGVPAPCAARRVRRQQVRRAAPKHQHRDEDVHGKSRRLHQCRFQPGQRHGRWVTGIATVPHRGTEQRRRRQENQKSGRNCGVEQPHVPPHPPVMFMKRTTCAGRSLNSCRSGLRRSASTSAAFSASSSIPSRSSGRSATLWFCPRHR